MKVVSRWTEFEKGMTEVLLILIGTSLTPVNSENPISLAIMFTAVLNYRTLYSLNNSSSYKTK